jgi:hypothetical protein
MLFLSTFISSMWPNMAKSSYGWSPPQLHHTTQPVLIHPKPKTSFSQLVHCWVLGYTHSGRALFSSLYILIQKWSGVESDSRAILGYSSCPPRFGWPSSKNNTLQCGSTHHRFRNKFYCLESHTVLSTAGRCSNTLIKP